MSKFARFAENSKLPCYTGQTVCQVSENRQTGLTPPRALLAESQEAANPKWFAANYRTFACA